MLSLSCAPPFRSVHISGRGVGADPVSWWAILSVIPVTQSCPNPYGPCKFGVTHSRGVLAAFGVTTPLLHVSSPCGAFPSLCQGTLSLAPMSTPRFAALLAEHNAKFGYSLPPGGEVVRRLRSDSSASWDEDEVCACWNVAMLPVVL